LPYRSFNLSVSLPRIFSFIRKQDVFSETIIICPHVGILKSNYNIPPYLYTDFTRYDIRDRNNSDDDGDH